MRAVLLSFALLGSACAASAGSLHGEWVSSSDSARQAVPFEVSFRPGGRFDFDSECRTFDADFETRDGHIIIGQAVNLIERCAGNAEKAKPVDDLVTFLSAGPAYQIEGDRLSLVGGGRTITFSKSLKASEL